MKEDKRKPAGYFPHTEIEDAHKRRSYRAQETGFSKIETDRDRQRQTERERQRRRTNAADDTQRRTKRRQRRNSTRRRRRISTREKAEGG